MKGRPDVSVETIEIYLQQPVRQCNPIFLYEVRVGVIFYQDCARQCW